MKNSERVFLYQFVPVVLTVIIFLFLAAVLYFEILFLNKFTGNDIILRLLFADILIGMTIYLKTSVDFAIFIGNLMVSYSGWKNRVMIEIGTAFGNAFGTMIILAIWNFFRHIEFLLALMIFIASLVLLKLAEEGLDNNADFLKKFLTPINKVSTVFLGKIIPNLTMKPKKNLTFWGLFGLSFTIPFVLGLDDFAGYVPLFSIVNVFGFAVGVFAGHMILNMALFISPKKTVAVVKNPTISVLGSLAFVGLAIWGFWEVFKILIP